MSVQPIDTSTISLAKLHSYDLDSYQKKLEDNISKKFSKMIEKIGSQDFKWEQDKLIEKVRVYRRISNLRNWRHKVFIKTCVLPITVGGLFTVSLQSIIAKDCETPYLNLIQKFFLPVTSVFSFLSGLAVIAYDRNRVPFLMSSFEKGCVDSKLIDFLSTLGTLKNWDVLDINTMTSRIGGVEVLYQELNADAKKLLPEKPKIRSVFDGMCKQRHVDFVNKVAEVSFRGSRFFNNTIPTSFLQLSKQHIWKLNSEKAVVKCNLDKLFRELYQNLLDGKELGDLQSVKKTIKKYQKIEIIRLGKFFDLFDFALYFSQGGTYFGNLPTVMAWYQCNDLGVQIGVTAVNVLNVIAMFGVAFSKRIYGQKMDKNLKADVYYSKSVLKFIESMEKVKESDVEEGNFQENLEEIKNTYQKLTNMEKTLFPPNTENILQSLFSSKREEETPLSPERML